MIKKTLTALIGLGILTAGSAQASPASHTLTSTIVTAPKDFRVQIELKSVMKRLLSRAGRTHYVFSGDTPSGWDCSGLVVWTYKQFNVDLPHSATAQAHIGKVTNHPSPGGIVLFGKKYRTDFYDAGIYLGDGQIINANSMYGNTVIQSLSEYAKDRIRFVKVLND